MSPGASMRGDAGVTLLEMLVVLAIMAMAGVLTAPMLQGSRAAVQLHGAATALAALARSERAMAMRSSSERALFIDLQRRQFWSESQSPRAIPARSTLSASVAPTEKIGGAAVRVRFLPDGSSSGGTITLRDGGEQAVITVDWLTGATRLTWIH